MSDTAIRVEGLSKRYALGAVRHRPDSLREHLAEGVWGLLRGRRRTARASSIWALRDLSFAVRHGEVMGVIGRNGSGKSTLLKILTRITEPTAGRAELYGRVASLLEVGTGFDRDLTGRENIYLSGAVLGMRRAEIRRKFDAIVAFAEVERFIDTPVKRYSSGMYVRLAFAVAAHLEPEILLVDEVLAVGDARFQKKCLAKMHDFGQAGRTVLFVSHSMPAITRLCQRALLLEEGRLLQDGPAHAVVMAYLRSDAGTMAAREWPDPRRAPQGRVARLRAVRVRNAAGQVADTVDIREPVTIEVEYDVLEAGHVLTTGLRFDNESDVEVFSSFDLDPAWRGRPRPAGRYTSSVRLPGNFLSEGRLFVSAGLTTVEPWVEQAGENHVVAFQVIEAEVGEARGDWGGEYGGAVRPVLPWRTTHLGTAAGVAASPAEACRP